MLLRRETLAKLIEHARDDRPKSLDDLLRDYDADKIKTLTAGFLMDSSSGHEII